MTSYLLCVDQQDESVFANGIQALQPQWKKCVKRKREHVEYQPHLIKFHANIFQLFAHPFFSISSEYSANNRIIYIINIHI